MIDARQMLLYMIVRALIEEKEYTYNVDTIKGKLNIKVFLQKRIEKLIWYRSKHMCALAAIGLIGVYIVMLILICKE